MFLWVCDQAIACNAAHIFEDPILDSVLQEFIARLRRGRFDSLDEVFVTHGLMERRKADLTFGLVVVVELQFLETSTKRTSIVLLSCVEYGIDNLQRLVDGIISLYSPGRAEENLIEV